MKCAAKLVKRLRHQGGRDGGGGGVRGWREEGEGEKTKEEEWKEEDKRREEEWEEEGGTMRSRGKERKE